MLSCCFCLYSAGTDMCVWVISRQGAPPSSPESDGHDPLPCEAGAWDPYIKIGTKEYLMHFTMQSWLSWIHAVSCTYFWWKLWEVIRLLSLANVDFYLKPLSTMRWSTHTTLDRHIGSRFEEVANIMFIYKVNVKTNKLTFLFPTICTYILYITLRLQRWRCIKLAGQNLNDPIILRMQRPPLVSMSGKAPLSCPFPGFVTQENCSR